MKYYRYCLFAGLVMFTQCSLQAQYVNESFESPTVSGMSSGTTPDGWGWYDTIGSGTLRDDGLTSTISYSGNQSLFFTTSTSQGAGYESIYLHGTPSTLSLTPADQVTCDVWLRSDTLNPYAGDCTFVLAMEFHDSTQSGNPFEGQGLIFAGPGDMSTAGWTKFSVTASPTAFADNLFFVVKSSNYASGSYTASSGTFYVDNIQASVVAVPEPSALAMTGLGLIALVAFRRTKARY